MARIADQETPTDVAADGLRRGRPTSPDDPLPWVVRFASLVPEGGSVLDVAAGGGRHTRWFAARGWHVVAVDRDTSALLDLAVIPSEPPSTADPATSNDLASTDGAVAGLGADVEVVEADLEEGPWPFPERRFDGVVVTNYLHRPLLSTLVASVAPGGVLIYQTFARGQERYGRPRNPDWLLRPGELLEAVRGRLRVVAYEDLTTDDPARIQRVAAVADD